MEALLERIAVALETIAKNGGRIGGGSASSKPRTKKSSGDAKGFQVEITSLGAMWRSGTGMFYNGTTTYEGVEYKCSIGVGDKLGKSFEPGDTVIVEGVPEKKEYKGEESLMIFANSADVVIKESSASLNSAPVVDDFPF